MNQKARYEQDDEAATMAPLNFFVSIVSSCEHSYAPRDVENIRTLMIPHRVVAA